MTIIRAMNILMILGLATLLGVQVNPVLGIAAWVIGLFGYRLYTGSIDAKARLG